MSDSEDLVYYKENIDNPRADKNIAWGSVPTDTRSIRAAIAKSVLDFPNRCDRLTVDDFVEGRWKNPDTENVIRKQFLALSDEDKVAILRMSENAGLCQELAPH